MLLQKNANHRPVYTPYNLLNSRRKYLDIETEYYDMCGIGYGCSSLQQMQVMVPKFIVYA